MCFWRSCIADMVVMMLKADNLVMCNAEELPTDCPDILRTHLSSITVMPLHSRKCPFCTALSPA